MKIRCWLSLTLSFYSNKAWAFSTVAKAYRQQARCNLPTLPSSNVLMSRLYAAKASPSTTIAPPAVTGDVPQVAETLLDEILAVATDAAKKAGAIILENAQGADVSSNKANARDLLTQIDPLCEKTIRECVVQAFPSHGFLGEEDVPPGPEAAAAAVAEKLKAASEADQWLWIVDPIDGTTNFVHGMPLCMPSIAASYQGKVMVAVIYDCHRKEMYTAVRGRGAYCNDQKLKVAETPELGQAVVAMGSPPGEESMKKSIQVIPALMPRVRTLRFLGSAALMLAWVAHHGRLTAYWEWDLSAWDTAAGALLITEAGGEMTDLEGEPYTLVTRKICASNGGAVHQELLRLFREEAKIV